MNRISFNGSTEVITDFAERFLSKEGGRAKVLEETREEYGESLQRIARDEDVDPLFLEIVVDFLLEYEMTDREVRALIESGTGQLVTLARDVGVLRGYLMDGTITDVEIIDEMQF